VPVGTGLGGRPALDVVRPVVGQREPRQRVALVTRLDCELRRAGQPRDLGGDGRRREAGLLLPALLGRLGTVAGDVVGRPPDVLVVVANLVEPDAGLGEPVGHHLRERDVVHLLAPPAGRPVDVGVLGDEARLVLLVPVDVLQLARGDVDEPHEVEDAEHLIEVPRPDEVVAVPLRLPGADGLAPRDRRGGDGGALVGLVLDGQQRHQRRPVLVGQRLVVGDGVRERQPGEELRPAVGVGPADGLVAALEGAVGLAQSGGRVGTPGEAERERLADLRPGREPADQHHVLAVELPDGVGELPLGVERVEAVAAAGLDRRPVEAAVGGHRQRDGVRLAVLVDQQAVVRLGRVRLRAARDEVVVAVLAVPEPAVLDLGGGERDVGRREDVVGPPVAGRELDVREDGVVLRVRRVLDGQLPLVALAVAGLGEDVPEQERIVLDRLDPAVDRVLRPPVLLVRPGGVRHLVRTPDEEVHRPEVHRVDLREPRLGERPLREREPHAGGIRLSVVGDGPDSEGLAGGPGGLLAGPLAHRRGRRQRVQLGQRPGRLQPERVRPAQRRRAVQRPVVEGLLGEIARRRRQRAVLGDELVEVGRPVEEGVAVSVVGLQEDADVGGGERAESGRHRPYLLAVLTGGPPAVVLVPDQAGHLAAARVPEQRVERRPDVVGQPVEVLLAQRRARYRVVVPERARQLQRAPVEPVVGRPLGQAHHVRPRRPVPETVQPVEQPFGGSPRLRAHGVGHRRPRHRRERVDEGRRRVSELSGGVLPDVLTRRR